MKKKIIVACDSFKGSLSSFEANAAIKDALIEIDSNIEVTTLAMADGGEGTMQVLAQRTGVNIVECGTFDPLMRPLFSKYAIGNCNGINTAIIEMASSSGLTLLTKEERNPWHTTTYGTGRMIEDAWNRGARDFIIGIGGSATNDGGMGMLAALGVKFYDKKGNLLSPVGGELGNVAWIDLSGARKDIMESHYTIICDVDNPLYGYDGAACVYGPQKGADHQMIQKLDDGLHNYAAVMEKTTGKDLSTVAGAGAAGGLGFAFLQLFNSRLKKGIDAVLDFYDFDKIVANADLVITGEGKSDMQTLNGKVPYGVMRRAGIVPTVIISGLVENEDALLQAGFAAVYSAANDATDLDYAMRPEIAIQNLIQTIHLYTKKILSI